MGVNLDPFALPMAEPENNKAPDYSKALWPHLIFWETKRNIVSDQTNDSIVSRNPGIENMVRMD